MITDIWAGRRDVQWQCKNWKTDVVNNTWFKIFKIQQYIQILHTWFHLIKLYKEKREFSEICTFE